MRGVSRRQFLRRGALTAGGAAIALAPGSAIAHRGRRAGFGELVDDPGGLIDLPRGFRYRVVQTVEDRLSGGAPVPGDFDGMAAFPGRRDSVVLVRNHELRTRDLATKAPVPGRNPYAADAPGGTTALVVDRDRRVAESFVTSSGTLNNCAGGATPWGTWLTCEEDRTTGHGFVFEVDPSDPENRLSRTPIRAMGFFSHEAVDIDPRTGIAYLTEDDFRGAQVPPEQEVPGATRSSFLYRYLPDNRSQRAGSLHDGGRLQVMCVDEAPLADMDLGSSGDRFRVVWRGVGAEDPAADALRVGGARFQRLEGCFFAGGAFWFDDTSGGENRHGQLFRLLPSGDPAGGGVDVLELFLEGDNAEQMDSPDNICITPWGDLWFAEDGDGTQRVMGVTPDGGVYEFARNRLVGSSGPGDDASEFCGPAFSPDGRTFFLNIQDPGHTLAIWGPFPRRDAGRGRALAAAVPRHPWAPRVSGAAREYAERHGLSAHEAAAYERLGAALG